MMFAALIKARDRAAVVQDPPARTRTPIQYCAVLEYS